MKRENPGTNPPGIADNDENAGQPVAQSVLELPDAEPWPDAVDGQALLDELEQVVTRFVVLPGCGTRTLALWALHTYAYQLRDVSTYVGIESPEKRCGKTTLLTVLGELVNRPVMASNISSPAFFRVIEETRPTLLIDEADTFLQGNDEMCGILNSGYNRKSAYVVRVANQTVDRAEMARLRGAGRAASPAQDSGSRLARFSCWCPKVMAAIGRLPDTLADRCIVIRMQRKTADEPCERLRNLDAAELRRRCARFVLDGRERIANARPEIPEGLNDRAADIWEPLLALADLAGGHWPERSRQAAVELSARAQEQNPKAAFLLDLLRVFVGHHGDRIFSRTVVAGLNEMTDRPWMETMRGREVTELWLAQQVRTYGIRPRSLRIGDAMAKGYVKVEFHETFRRYVPYAEMEALRGEYEGEQEGVEKGDSSPAEEQR